MVPLRSSAEDWERYVSLRRTQGFTAIQFVATQWRGGRKVLDRPVYQIEDGHIASIPETLRTLDARVAAIAAQGLVPAPVMLWALTADDPGQALSEAEAIALARHLKSRWEAYGVVWLLGGDGPYKDADRWKRIGRAVFPEHKVFPEHDLAGDSAPRSPLWRPVTLHPSGQNWVADRFLGEPWYDFIGYQSGHGSSERELKWLTTGPPAQQWTAQPTVPVVNLEPNYEGHPSYHTGKAFGAAEVRRAAWWSLLVAPPAGITYGNNEIWVWNTTAGPAEGHARLGLVQPWSQGLETPGIASMTLLKQFFETGPWQRLRPAQGLLLEQPGTEAPTEFVAAARADNGSWCVIYLPVGGTITLDGKELPADLQPACSIPAREHARQSPARRGNG